MLEEIINRYLPQFRVASEKRQVSETVRLLNEMKAEFRSIPPDSLEIIQYFESIIGGTVKPGAQFAFVAAWNNKTREYCKPLCQILEAEALPSIS